MYIAALWATDDRINLTKQQLERVEVNKKVAIERRKRKKEEEKREDQKIQKLQKFKKLPEKDLANRATISFLADVAEDFLRQSVRRIILRCGRKLIVGGEAERREIPDDRNALQEAAKDKSEASDDNTQAS